MLFLTRTDKIILGIASLVLAVFSYFLYDDSLLFDHAQESSFEKIGQIYQSENDVRLKSAIAFSWMPASKNNEIHQKDSVFTGDRSEVAIQLNDGSIISLKENSLITLNIKNGQMTLDLKYGDIVGQLTENSQIKVKSGKEEIDLTGGKSSEKSIINLNKSRTGQIDLKLQQGSAHVKTNREKKALEKGKSINLAKSGQIKELPKPIITLLTPHQSVLSQAKDSDPIPLRWKSSQKVPKYTIEISKNSTFDKVDWKSSTEDDKIDATLAGGVGAYYWRVKALASSGQELASSPTQVFSVVRFETPLILLPEKDKPLTFELKPGTPLDQLKSEFKMSWKTSDSSRRFHYQLAADSDFTKLIKESVVEGFESPSPAVPSGTYYLRVRSEGDTEKYSSWSATRSITVSISVDPRPLPPRLVKNTIDFDPAAPDSRNPSAIVTPEVQWTKPVGATNYRIQIAKSKNFSDGKTYQSKEEKFSWSEFQPGPSYYRVYAVNERGLASYPSEVGTIKVALSGPVLKPLKDLVVHGTDKKMPPPTKEVQIAWNRIPAAKKYNLEMDSNKEFSSAMKFEVDNDSVPVVVPKPGHYSLRVQALNESGQPITSFSPVAEFNYIYKVPLITPALQEPFDKATVFMQQDTEPFIWLEWKNVPEAIAYQLDVSITPDFKNVLISTKTKDPRFLVKNKIPYGKIYWRVRALSENPEMNSEWTANREFSILYKANETFQ